MIGGNYLVPAQVVSTNHARNDEKHSAVVVCQQRRQGVSIGILISIIKGQNHRVRREHFPIVECIEQLR